jgi:hypothetical protein
MVIRDVEFELAGMRWSFEVESLDHVMGKDS